MERRKQALSQLGFWDELDSPAQEALAGLAILLQRPAGTLLQLEGQPAEAMYMVVAGRVKVLRSTVQGREQVLFVAGPGQHFNSVPAFDAGPCPATAEALTVVEVLALPVTALQRAVAEHPTLALALLKEFTGRLRHLVNLVDELALHTVQGRLARLLISQAETAARGGIPEPLTQSDIAARIGTVREMVARTLKAFEALGLIALNRGAITILDQAGLEAQISD